MKQGQSNSTEVGSHSVILYNDLSEIERALGSFFFSGYRREKKLLFIYDRLTLADLLRAIEPYGMDLEELRDSGRIEVASARDTYLRDGVLDLERMAKKLEEKTREALDSGFDGLCVVGEGSWIFDENFNAAKMLEYESKMDEFIGENPLDACCIYDTSVINKRMLLQISGLHPFIFDTDSFTPNYDYFKDTYGHVCESDECRQLYMGTATMASEMFRIRGFYTEDHCKNVSRLACAIARKMNEIRLAGELETAGMIHDIGMMTIFSDMIGKPGKLAWFESQLLHEHPLVGYELVKKVPFPRPIAKAILEHHERLDGSGYPLGLKGDEISIGGKILAVAEIVSAMSFYRIYRDDYGVEVALNEIEKEADHFYDSDVVRACLKCFEEGFEF